MAEGHKRAALAREKRHGKLLPMHVIFRRTGERRYAVVVQVPGKPEQVMNPAPGFDEHIPHDLVHYVVEAELELRGGVFGRAAQGGGTFAPAAPDGGSARQRARERRKQARREQALAREQDNEAQMRESEHLAYCADIAWRRQHGQRPDPRFSQTLGPLSHEDAQRVERVVTRLNEVAPRWRALPIGDALAFVWPSPQPQFVGESRETR